MVERCVRCGVREDEVRLFDAIYEGRMNKICERCSIIENVPIIKRPNSSQLKESEKGDKVYNRMKRISGIKEEKKPDVFYKDDKLKELEKNSNLEAPENKRLNLVEHFHWTIMKERRRKGLSQEQLAEELGESKIAVEMLEKAKLPENAGQLIKKLEQFFQVKLKKESEIEKYLKDRKEEPVLLDDEGNILDEIPEEELEKEPEGEPEKIESVKEEKKEEDSESKNKDEGVDYEKGEFDINKADLNKVTIDDLRRLNRRRIEATKQEQMEEKKNMEERQKLIEARKEELRLRKEKESKELDKELGGEELLEDSDSENEGIDEDLV